MFEWLKDELRHPELECKSVYSPHSKVQLVNFDEIAAINALLCRIGIESNFGEFTADHLQDVLQKQYGGTRIESIELVNVSDCSLGGTQNSNGSVIEASVICIPVDVRTIVAVQNKRYQLDLHVRLNANATKDGFDVTSDIFVREQVPVPP